MVKKGIIPIIVVKSNERKELCQRFEENNKQTTVQTELPRLCTQNTPISNFEWNTGRHVETM